MSICPLVNEPEKELFRGENVTTLRATTFVGIAAKLAFGSDRQNDDASLNLVDDP
jgi:hypothetical protein